MNILVVEDQFRDMEYICGILEELAPEAEITKAGDTASALMRLCSKPVDVAFIDIDLPDENGFRFASKLREMEEYRLLHIVFVTGTANNPLKAHREYHCYDYITKPYTKKAFAKIITPLLEGISKSNISRKKREPEESRIVFLKAGNEMHIVKAEDILFAEITGREISVILPYKTICGVRMKFEDFISHINSADFVRCHKSYAVSTSKIKSIITINYRLSEVNFGEIYSGDRKCLISKGYRDNVEKCLI